MPAPRPAARSATNCSVACTACWAGRRCRRPAPGAHGQHGPAHRADAIVVGTPSTSPQLAALGLDLSALGEEGYLLRSVRIDGRPATAVAAF